MEFLFALLILAALAWFASAPLRHTAAPLSEDPERTDLEALKESKYRQIRDAELDREQGKLSPEDWKEIDAELRLEAVKILKRIDRLG